MHRRERPERRASCEPGLRHAPVRARSVRRPARARPSSAASRRACRRARGPGRRARCRRAPARAAAATGGSPREHDRAASSRASRCAESGRPPRGVDASVKREERRQHAGDRQERHQPAPEGAVLGAHERRGRRATSAPAASRHGCHVDHDRHGPGQRRERGHAAEPPGERPEVVDDVELLRRAELARRFFGHRTDSCASSRMKRGSPATRRGLRRGTRTAPRHPPAPGPRAPRVGGPRAPARAARVTRMRTRREQRQHDDAGRVLRGRPRGRGRGRRAGSRARGRACITPAAPISDAVQRHERGHVVERQVGVEDGQERHRLQRRGEQPHARGRRAARRAHTAAKPPARPGAATVTRATR